jgi:diguanylate cyclase (GGDEF)-like protein
MAWEDELRTLGWEVEVSGHLLASMELLATRPLATLVLPLTLLPRGVEWQRLRAGLSPGAPVPWLLVPEHAEQAGSVIQLLREDDPLADWASPDAPAAELDARLQALCNLQERWNSYHQRMDELAGQLETDHKTELANDRHFRRRLQEECERSTRHGSPLVLMLIDLDDFKQLNDEHSYEFGDEALRHFASCLRQSVRAIDIPARIGGDEFAVILPSTTLPEGIAVAKRMRQSLRQAAVGSSLESEQLQASIGLAASDGHSALEAQQLFLRSNDALKQAKGAGKDRIAFFDTIQRRSVAQP